MKKILFVFFLTLAFLSANAQTPQPLSAHYIACNGAQVQVGFVYNSAIQYYWYNAATDGNLLQSYSSNTYTVIKNSSPLQTVYAEPRIGGVSQTRIPVNIELSTICGTISPTGCAAEGTIIFKEDFGGNSSSDPFNKPTGMPQQVDGYSYTTAMTGPYSIETDGFYYIAKKTPSHSNGTWYSIDDHTSPNNPNTGYCITFNASLAPGQFYKHRIDNLCHGTRLTFSAWLVNLMRNGGTKPNLLFRIKDISNNVLASYYTGDVPFGLGYWTMYGFSFITQNSSIILEIVNNAAGGMGNDFSMDDIEIRICPPNITFSKTLFEVCEQGNVDIAVYFDNDGSYTNPVYQWYYCPTNDPNSTAWTPIGDNSSVLNLTAPVALGYYRVGISGGDSGTECEALSNPVQVVRGGHIEASIAKTICHNESFVFGEKTLTTSGVYKDTVINADGCDSIITLTLNVLSEIIFEEISRVCQDDGSFTLSYQIVPNENDFANYSVEFDQKAQENGFTNLYTQPFPADNQIVIDFPTDVEPNIYSFKIIWNDENNICSDFKDFDVEINFSKVLAQKWNDVIAVLNSHYNGGYEFSAFQWYKSNEPIAGETNSYIYLPEGLDFTAEYSVLLTRKNDGVMLMTCPFIPVWKDESEFLPFPVFSNGSQLQVKSPQPGTVSIWHITGVFAGQQNINKDITDIHIPLSAGVYILKFLLKNGTSSQSITVKK